MSKEIKVGDWVRLKTVKKETYFVYMLVKDCDYRGATVVWFLENRDLAEKYLPLKLLEIIPEEDWN